MPQPSTGPCHLFFTGFKTADSYSYIYIIYIYICPCHLFFRGFKTAVCPPSNAPNAPNPSAGLQGNNSYSYMPLPSVFQGVQDCRLPALKRSKPFRRPPRQQLLQLHASAICFSGGSRLPFARPQTLQTLPQASKATTLTATCRCHLFFRGFKTAACLALNAPNPSADLQGNNSYSYMPLPSVFQGVQDCRLPGFKRSKPFRRPPRQQLLQLQLYTCPCTCPCHLFFRGFKTAVCAPSNAPNAPNPSAGLQGNNSYSYMPLPSVFQGVQDCRLPALKRSKRSKPFRRPPRQQLLQLYTAIHAPAICFSGGSRLPFARPQTLQTLQTLPQASKATTLTATCPCHLFFRGFKTAVCPPSKTPNPSAGLQGNNSYSYMPLPSVFQGVQDCRLPALKRSKPFRRPPRQQLLQLHAPAICFSGGSRLPFARPQRLQTLPQASKATTLTATCPCHLFFRGFKTAVCPPSNAPNASAGLQGNNSYSYMPLPSVFQGVQDCRLPALKRSKRYKPFRRPPRQQLLQLQLYTCPCTCPCHLFFRGFKTAVCPPSNAPNAPNPSAGLQGNNSYSYMPLRQQLLQLHASAICFSGGSRLPFARPQTLQTLPQASKATTLTATCRCHLFSGGSRLPLAFQTLPQTSKATTLTATCPCHLFFRGFKTAVCPPSNAPNAPNPSAGLQGNNSYSYSYIHAPVHAPAICFPGGSRLPFARPQTLQTLQTLPQASKATTLTATCQGVQDCRLPALKRSKRSKPFRRPPRQQLLQLHAPAICFSGGSRLPFARPQTLQTLPQASKATTLTATCLCHLFFRGFKTAVCPPSNAPNAPNPSAGLQGNNSYSYMPLPSVFQGVQDCRLPGFKRSKPFRRPPRQQLLQLHAPAICFSGGSRLPLAWL